MRLMKTKKSLSATHFIQVTLDVPVPDTVHFLRFSEQQVQTALRHFLAENPYVMEQVFEQLEKLRQNVGLSQDSSLPKVSQKQREKVLAAIKDLADDDHERSPQDTQHIIDLLENHKPSRGKINSTQLLRQIRANG
jgi:translation initiation factor 2 beta subunit (eIF-2beta)/eIF-5